MEMRSATNLLLNQRRTGDGAASRRVPTGEVKGVRTQGHPGAERLAGIGTALNAGPRAAQLKQVGENLNASAANRSPQPSANATGLPGALKAGVEALSGLAMDDVRVHYGSAEPAALQAHAFTQGTDIHVAPGQERHLAHESWHVVQQKQGRVRPTLQAKGVEINDDAALEREADSFGAMALENGLRLQGAAGIEGGIEGRSAQSRGTGPGQPAQLRGFSTKLGMADTKMDPLVLSEEFLPQLVAEHDATGLGNLYVALNADVEEGGSPEASELLNRVEEAARQILDVVWQDPRAVELQGLGVLRNPQVEFWLSSDYNSAPPRNLAVGIIAEALSAKHQRDTYGPDFRVLTGLKVGIPDASRREGFRATAEIDNLRVRPGAGGLVPVELVEAKAGKRGKGKIKSEISAKLKALGKVGTGAERLYLDEEDVTDEFDLRDLKALTTSTATADDFADLPLVPGEIAALYEALCRLQTFKYSTLRVLAL